MIHILLQAIPPVNPGAFDDLSYITNALDQLVGVLSDTFISNAQTLLDRLGLFALVLGALTWTYGYLTGNHIFSGEHYWRVLIRYLIAFNLLRYFNSPLPLIGYSFHEIFTEEARFLAEQVNIKGMDQMVSVLNDIYAHLQKPHFWDITANVLYYAIILLISFVEAVLFLITSFSFWAIGVGIVLGPFAVVAYLFRATQHYFWAWVDYMIKYSLYRVVAAVLANVWAVALVTFIGDTLAGNAKYNLGSWWAVLPHFIIMNVTFIFACIMVGSIVNDLTSGKAYAGAGVGVLRWLF